MGRTTVIFCHRVFGADAGGVRAPGARSCRPLSCSHRKGMHASTACGASVRLTAAGKLGRTHRPFPPRRRYVGGVSVPSPHRPREDEPTLQTLQDPIQGAHLGFAFELAFQTHWVSAFQLRQGAAERRHPTGREQTVSPTLQTLQEPILGGEQQHAAWDTVRRSQCRRREPSSSRHSLLLQSKARGCVYCSTYRGDFTHQARCREESRARRWW